MGMVVGKERRGEERRERGEKDGAQGLNRRAVITFAFFPTMGLAGTGLCPRVNGLNGFTGLTSELRRSPIYMEYRGGWLEGQRKEITICTEYIWMR
jgi:hypothetical protein